MILNNLNILVFLFLGVDKKFHIASLLYTLQDRNIYTSMGPDTNSYILIKFDTSILQDVLVLAMIKDIPPKLI